MGSNLKMINNIKIGIKIATLNLDLIPDIYENRNIIDFIEIILTPEFTSKDIDFIKILELPYVIHIPNSNFGIDFGNIEKNLNNVRYIDKINRFKNSLIPLCYIVHPESRDVDLSIKNIKKLDVKPVAIENMPFKSIVKGELVGYDPDSLMKFFQCINDLEFCFDINHAIKTAISKKIDYLAFIKKFLRFKQPKIFHISGGKLNIEIDEHLHLFEGDYDVSKIKELMLKHNDIIYLTFETPRNNETRIADDLRNIKYFIKS